MKNETVLIETLSEIIEKAAVGLQGTVGYIFALGERDFYNINVKDLFTVCLSDVCNPDNLSKLGIAPNKAVADYTQLSDLMFFAFAVRTPYLRRVHEIGVNDRFIFNLFAACEEKGAVDPDNFIWESFKANMKSAKSPRNSQPEPPFNGEWFRRWVYSYGGELSAITNKNMFLLGCMDALFPLYYAKLTDVLTELIVKNANESA